MEGQERHIMHEQGAWGSGRKAERRGETRRPRVSGKHGREGGDERERRKRSRRDGIWKRSREEVTRSEGNDNKRYKE